MLPESSNGVCRIIALVSVAFIPLENLQCTAADLPDLDLNVVVQKYLKQESSIDRFVAEYAYRTKALSGLGSEKGNGTFGFELPGTHLAAKVRGAHALFNGATTTYLMGNYGFVVKVPSGAFGGWHYNPGLLFDFMQDTQYTRVSRVLSDASGPKSFGEAKLIEGKHLVMDRPCYLIEGTYDRVKLNNLNRPKPILWKYRLFLDPGFGMQMVRKETFNVAQDIPMGILEVEKLMQMDQLWIPVQAKFTDYWYEKQGDKNVAHPATEIVFQIHATSIRLNGPPDFSLFSLTWPEGTTVRDDTNASVYVVGAKVSTH